MTWPALTPLEFSAACTMSAVALIAVSGGLVWLILRWLPRKWTVAAHVDAALPPGRCDWCDGFTLDRSKCNCKDVCTFVPLCGAREGLQ